MGDKNWKKIFDSSWKREGTLFIQFLLDAGLDVNAVNKFGKTMLSYAAERGHVEIVEVLVQKGADANVANSDGSKPLHVAAQYFQKDIVKFFLNREISVDSYDNEKCTPLHYIASKSDISSDGRARSQELVHILVNHYADIDAVNRKGCTPLLLAAQTSHKHIVDLLIKLGADLESCDENKWTVLHHACEKGWSGVVRTLLEDRYETNLNAKSCDGCAPAVIAAKHSRHYIVKLVVESGADVNEMYDVDEKKLLLHNACERGWLGVVKSLVSKQCDLNAKDSDGITPLMTAADNANLSVGVVKYLINKGANVNCCDKYGRTLLHHACARGKLEVVKSIVSKGCNLNAKDKWVQTPLLLAADCSQLSVVEFLIEYGADVVGCDEDGFTVLHFACENMNNEEGWLEVVKSLIKKGSDVNAQTVEHDSPLHIAIKKFNIEIVKHLLNVGANCNLLNNRGETPLNMFLLRSNCLEVITLFLRSGAYFQNFDYAIISNTSSLIQGILQNVQLCIAALINKFNNLDLPKIYKIPSACAVLPPIEELKIGSPSIVHDITASVKYEIQAKGYCNLLKVRPILLRNLCVLTLLKHYRK